MICYACPFTHTDLYTQVQNYGCLPEPADFIRIKHEHNLNMSCHNSSNGCAGFVRYLTNNTGLGLNPNAGDVMSNETWRLKGEVAAAYAAGRRANDDKIEELEWELKLLHPDWDDIHPGIED